jgi:sigma-B regulation protein RsbU (phosphoserine phosphatase)
MKAGWPLVAALLVATLAGCVAMDASAPPTLSVEARDQLREELPSLVLACSLIAIGIAAMVLAKFHWSAQGVELLSFGAFSLLYGVRLAAWLPTTRWLVDLSPTMWQYAEAIITYVIPVPVLFFLEPFLGRVRLLRWAWRLQLGYALFGSAFDIAVGSPFAAMGPYRVLVITWFVLAVYFMFARTGEVTKHLRIVRAGLLVFLLLAGHATISGSYPLPGTVSAEPLGLFVFFMSLGYVVVDDFFSSQKELGAINRELETARKIQSSVLPERLPEGGGFELAVRYVPVSAVAGDFYDYLEHERGVSFLVADVSGHGVPAALIASMVKIAYSAQNERVEKPSAVLAEINRILCGTIRGQFVTGGVLFVGSDASSVAYASAGHPPLIVVRANGQTSELKLDSVLMGFVSEFEYRETEIELEPGDKVVLYTDGLVEAMSSAHDFFGVERLLAHCRAHARDGAEELAQGIVDRVRAWSGRAFDDDVTLLVLSRR